MKHRSIVSGSPSRVFVLIFLILMGSTINPPLESNCGMGIPPGSSQTLHYGKCVPCLCHSPPHTQVVNDSGSWKEGRKDLQQHHRKVIMVAQSTLVITLVHEERHDAKSILWTHMLEKTISHEWVAPWASCPLILCAFLIPVRLLPITATQLGTNFGFTLTLAIWIQ